MTTQLPAQDQQKGDNMAATDPCTCAQRHGVVGRVEKGPGAVSANRVLGAFLNLRLGMREL